MGWGGGGEGLGWQHARIAAVRFDHLKASSVSVIYFIDEGLMCYPQDEKEIKTRKSRKRRKVHLVSVVSMIHIHCHSNGSHIVTALVGKHRSLHNYGL